MLGALRLEKHPDKTFIGRIERGFDFLGFHFSRDGLMVAKATIERFVARGTRLYEQDQKEPSGPSRLGMYVRRWVAWAAAGSRGIVLPRTDGKFHLLWSISDAVACSSATLPRTMPTHPALRAIIPFQ